MINLGNLNRNQNPNQNNGQSVSLNLNKGMSLDLTKAAKPLNRVRIGLGWSANENRGGVSYDLDASAILLNHGRINDNADVIFYNQTDTGRGVRSAGDNRIGSYNMGGVEEDDETIYVDLARIPNNTDEVRFIVTIHDAMARQQNFGQVRNAYIRVVDEDDGQELCRYRLNEHFALQISCEIASIKRDERTGIWKFVAIGQGSTKDLEGMLISYGVR